ncbi:uncharacterized protein LOC101236463 isoform X1 [Hydra vulgaris]|uniref:uncharacterized protein LOC101236463 isoform X1 n=1 Tax=Hydra vulgaris TaxID=6087 RepID=UPI001F5EE0F7|nr:uncharacterized protein LOC101236463 [Hydra vulgaris]
MTKRTVLISGCSGAGKSFTGDYLEMMCGFYHVDGDTFIISKEPEHVEWKTNLMKAFYEYWFDEKSAPRELWEPYYQGVANLVKKAHESNSEVVVSISVYNREVRDFFRLQFPHYIFILLNLSEDELVRRHIKRFEAFAESQSKTIEEVYQEIYKEPYSMDNYLKQTKRILKGFQPIAKDEVLSFAIDVSDEMYKTLHDVLQLPPPQGIIPIEDIANKNYKRWKK